MNVMPETSIHDDIVEVKCAACRQEYKNISVYYKISGVNRVILFNDSMFLVSKLLVHVGFFCAKEYSDL